MNKTIDISLAGLLFHLEETAYYKLKKYLEHVRNSLNNEDDIDEIINEIEARIAELLTQKQQNPNEVVNEKQIDEIIEVIGKPEDFEEEENKSANSSKIRKRLFRDPEHAMIGGVAAGFAHYLGIDITLMRLLFLILLFVTKGSFLFIYVLLWIIIPKAKTVSDKLKMKGAKVNLDNIVENVNSENENISSSNLGKNIEQVGAGVGEVLLKLVGLFLSFISGIVILALIISALAISPMSDLSLVINNDTAVMQHIGLPLMLLNTLVLLLVGIPFVLLFILGLKLLFPHIKMLSRNILLILGTIWIIAFVVLTVKSISGLAHKSFGTTVKESYLFSSPKDTLFLKVRDVSEMSVHNKLTKLTNDDITIDFKTSPDSKFHLLIYTYAQGISLKDAKKAGKEAEYPIKMDSVNGQLLLADKFFYPQKRAYSDYHLKITVQIPEGKFIKLGDLEEFFATKYNNGTLIYNHNGQIKKIPEEGGEEKEDTVDKMEIRGDNMKISIDDHGLKIKAKDKQGKNAVIEINEKGVQINKDR